MRAAERQRVLKKAARSKGAFAKEADAKDSAGYQPLPGELPTTPPELTSELFNPPRPRAPDDGLLVLGPSPIAPASVSLSSRACIAGVFGAGKRRSYL